MTISERAEYFKYAQVLIGEGQKSEGRKEVSLKSQKIDNAKTKEVRP
jgi:hypothetical protein